MNGVILAGGYVAVGAPPELGGSGLEVPELLHARAPSFQGFSEPEEQAGDVIGDGVLELVASWPHADQNERVQVIRRPVAPGLVPMTSISVRLDGSAWFGE